MKEIVLTFVISVFALSGMFACEEGLEIKPNKFNWEKVQIPTSFDDNFKKIISKDGSLLIFTKNLVYRTKDMHEWLVFSIPEPLRELGAPSVTVFKDNLYLASSDGLYISYDLGELWLKVADRWVDKVVSDDKYIYTFLENHVYRSEDGKNFEKLDKISQMTKTAIRQPGVRFAYTNADGGRVVASAIVSNGGLVVYESHDYGLNWTKSRDRLIKDFDGGQDVWCDRFNLNFSASGNIEINKQGGGLVALKGYGNDYYFVGASNSLYPEADKRNKGVIIKNNFESVFITKEKTVINDIEIFQNMLLAVGDNGSIYKLYLK